MNRRTALQATAWLALGYPLRQLASPQASPRFTADPFSASVASGDPRRDGVVLWTRLMPDPSGQRDWQRSSVTVDWEVATDENMRRIVRRGREIATPNYGHSVHANVTGLAPNRWYWYRFKTGSAQSPIGRTKTAPAAATDRIRFAFASCQQYHAGYYTAYQNMVKEDLDAVVFLGDYIYESNGATGTGPRKFTTPEPTTLEEYRARYALYRSDANLREAHRLFPWIITWDDHEVQNNYAGDFPENPQLPREDFLVRRAAAYQAHYEWLPLPKSVIPRGDSERLYRTLSFGPLARFIVLDGRQYRSNQACGDGTKAPCAEFLNERTMLGAPQEKWLDAELRASRSQWNIIANQVRMTVVDQTPGSGETYAMDQWAGYEAARKRITSSIKNSGMRNPVVVTGDIHSSWVGDLKVDYKDERAPIIGTEFVGTSISSGGDGSDSTPQAEAQLKENPQIKFYNNLRGYVTCEVTPKRFTSRFRVVEKVTIPDFPAFTRATFEIADGKPGAERV